MLIIVSVVFVWFELIRLVKLRILLVCSVKWFIGLLCLICSVLILSMVGVLVVSVGFGGKLFLIWWLIIICISCLMLVCVILVVVMYWLLCSIVMWLYIVKILLR